METKEKEYYKDSGSIAVTQQVTVDPIKVKEDTKSEEITISLNGNIFSGNTEEPLLQQVEAAGLSINYSCRSGLCGACRVTLESGDVEQEDSPALNQRLKDAGMILACCSVPKTDIEVVD